MIIVPGTIFGNAGARRAGNGFPEAAVQRERSSRMFQDAKKKKTTRGKEGKRESASKAAAKSRKSRRGRILRGRVLRRKLPLQGEMAKDRNQHLPNSYSRGGSRVRC